jgi:hypothetical protein
VIDTSLVSWLLANTSGYQVQVSKLDWDRTPPWIWLRRSGTTQETTLSGQLFGNFTSFYDLEMVSTDIDQLETDCDNLKTALQSITPSSTVGTTYVQALFVEDHSDDYIPKSVLNTDAGFFLCALQLQIFHLA